MFYQYHRQLSSQILSKFPSFAAPTSAVGEDPDEGEPAPIPIAIPIKTTVCLWRGRGARKCNSSPPPCNVSINYGLHNPEFIESLLLDPNSVPLRGKFLLSRFPSFQIQLSCQNSHLSQTRTKEGFTSSLPLNRLYGEMPDLSAWSEECHKTNLPPGQTRQIHHPAPSQGCRSLQEYTARCL